LLPVSSLASGLFIPAVAPPFFSHAVQVFRYVRAKKLRAMGVQKYDAGDAELQGEETINPIQVRVTPTHSSHATRGGGIL